MISRLDGTENLEGISEKLNEIIDLLNRAIPLMIAEEEKHQQESK